MSNQLAPGVTRGKWTLSSYTPGYASGPLRVKSMWLCTCTCGTTRRVQSDALNSGASRSCGCTIAGAHSRALGDVFSPLTRRRALI